MRARLWRVAQDVGTVTAREMPAGGVVVDLSGIQSEFLDALTEVFADGGEVTDGHVVGQSGQGGVTPWFTRKLREAQDIIPGLDYQLESDHGEKESG